MKILVLNGPNLNLLGIREPEQYGTKSYSELLSVICQKAEFLGVEIICRQSNHEGVLVDLIQMAYNQFDGIIVNAAAYTHTSIAIFDALKAVSLPSIEVHLTNSDEREPFRRVSYLRAACIETISGLGFESYTIALEHLVQYCRAKANVEQNN